MTAETSGAPGTDAQPFHTPPHSYRWAMLAGIWLIYFSFGILVASMAPLVAPITADLGISHGAMGIVLGAWPLVYIASSIPAGALIDRMGPRRSIMLCTMLITTSGILRGIADDYLTMFLAVAVFGLGGPLISIGAPKVMSLWFEGKERGIAMGLYISGPAIGSIISLSLTNSVMMPFYAGDWRAVLFTYAGVAVLCGTLWVLISAHPASRAMERQIAGEPRRSQFQVLGELLAEPVVRLILAMSVGMFIFNHGLNNWLPEILRTGGMDSATAGYWASIPTAIGIFAALIIPRFATEDRRLLVLGALFISAGVATMLLHLSAGPLLAFGLICQGVARGAMMAVAILVLVESRGVGSRNVGAAGGLFFSAAEVGGVLGPVLVGAIHDLTGGFAASLYMMTAICAVLLVMLSRLRSLTRRPS
jgi:CP family cyanate transporter-like MFS transporter